MTKEGDLIVNGDVSLTERGRGGVIRTGPDFDSRADLEARERRIVDGRVSGGDHAVVLAHAEVKLVMISRGTSGVLISQAEAKCLGRNCGS
jgi:hypothetical protein